MQLQLVLGNQLFAIKVHLKISVPVFMCEDKKLCTHYTYHKHKLIFFLASMRKYQGELIRLGYKVFYYKLSQGGEFFHQLEKLCEEKKVSEIMTYEVEDKFFEDKLKKFCQNKSVKLIIKQSPMFLVSREKFQDYLSSHNQPLMKSFYEMLRRDTGILMVKGKPEGGKFSFDSENRKKIPKKFNVIINECEIKSDKIIDEVKAIVSEYFSEHPGRVSNFWMATTRDEALDVLEKFVTNKIELFGAYEDAIDQRDPFLYHSILSPYLNIGFITPGEVISRVLECEAPLNSKEGFIRQIIGWREFVRGIYQKFSVIQEEKNFFNHQKKLTKHWYDGTSEIPPLDDAINKVNEIGYNHHIERLMIISNLMLLCEILPREVHRWFMEMYVDSSDWVMGPNVYGMAQFSDGGIFATKPYISGSSYIRKMGHYKKGEWCDVWDGLYWSFIDKHRAFFLKNYRMSMMVRLLDKMDQEKKKKIFFEADKFRQKMTI